MSMPSQGDTSKHLHTVINGETCHIEEKIRLAPLPSLQALLELDEMSFNEFDRTLKTRSLSELVIIKPMLELNSSSLLVDAVLDDTKAALSARSGSSIVKDPSDPFYSLIKEFQDVVCNNPSSVLPSNRGVRHEIDLVPGSKYCVTRQWSLPKEPVTSLTISSVTSSRPVWCVRVNLRTPHRPFVSGNRMASGALYTPIPR